MGIFAYFRRFIGTFAQGKASILGGIYPEEGTHGGKHLLTHLVGFQKAAEVPVGQKGGGSGNTLPCCLSTPLIAASGP